MKTVPKYLIISLLLLLGLGCACIMYIFFVPNATIFNLTYINNRIEKESDEFDCANVDTIELNSRSYEISVLKSKTDSIYVNAYSNSFGFVLKDNSDFNLYSKLHGSVLSFSIDEAYGFALVNESYIKLYIPKSKEFNLIINNRNANITVDDSDLKIKNLSYSTEKGSFNFAQGTLSGTLDINLRKGNFNIKKSVTTNNNNLNLKLTSGVFDANNSTLGNVNILSNKRGIIKIDTCEDLIENSKSSGGRITVDSLSYANIRAGDAKLKIGTVADTISVKMYESGSVSINTINGASSIETDSGNINVGYSHSTLVLYSDSGDINVKNATLETSVTANYGEVNINFSEAAPSYTEVPGARTLYAKIKNSKLSATGVEHIGNYNTNSDEGIVVSKNGRVNIVMNKVCGDNFIKGKAGNVKVVVEKTAAYKLTTSSNSGSVRVNLTQTPNYGGYTTKAVKVTFVNCNSTSNSLKVTTTSGNLQVFDTNFA